MFTVSVIIDTRRGFFRKRGDQNPSSLVHLLTHFKVNNPAAVSVVDASTF